MGKRWTLLLALMVLLAGGWAFYQLAVTVSRGGEHTPMYSVRRYDPYGSAALHQLLIQRRAHVHTLERPRLDADMRGVLVQVLPLPEDARGDDEDASSAMWQGAGEADIYALSTRQVAEWIAAGNTVVQLTRHYTPLMRELGVPEPAAPVDRIAERVEALQAHQRAGEHPDAQPSRLRRARSVNEDDPRRLVLRLPRRFPAALGQGEGSEGSARWRPLWRLAEDAGAADEDVVVGAVEHGNGRLIVIGAPTLALNHTIGQADDLSVLLELLGDGPVTFDEWSHGVGHIGTIMELIRDFGLLPVVAQVVLVILVYHWSTRGYRRVDRDRPPRPRASIEQVQTLGYLYQQGMSLDATAARVRDEVRRRLAEAWRCAPDRLEPRMTDDHGPLHAELRRLLKRADALRQRPGASAANQERALKREMASLLTDSHELARKRKGD